MPEKKDVKIEAPAGIVRISRMPQLGVSGTFEPPTLQELVEMQGAVLREKDAELEKQKVAAATVTNVALCLTKILIDLGYAVDTDTVGIPKDLSDYMEGARLTIGEDADRNVMVKINHRSPAKLGSM